MKPDFIKNLEHERRFFSFLIFSATNVIFPKKLEEKKYYAVYSERRLDFNKKMILSKYILKSAQGFYLSFDKKEEKDSWVITIYFEEKQESELQFFLNNFLKTFINETTDNK